MAVASIWGLALCLLVINQGLQTALGQAPHSPLAPLNATGKSTSPFNATSTSNGTSTRPGNGTSTPIEKTKQNRTNTPPNFVASPPTAAVPGPPSPNVPVSPSAPSDNTGGGGKRKSRALKDGEIAGIAIAAAAFAGLLVALAAFLRKRGVLCKDEDPLYSVAEPGMKPKSKDAKQAATCFAAGFTPMEAKEATAQLRTDVHSAVQAMELHLAGQLNNLALKPPFLPHNIMGGVMFQRYSLYHQCFVWLHNKLWSKEADFKRWPLFPVAVQVGVKPDEPDPTVQALLQNAVNEEHYANYLASVRDGVEDPESQTELAITEVAQAMLHDLHAPAGCLEPMKRVVRQAVITRLLIGAINKSSTLEVPGCRPARDFWTEAFEEQRHSIHMEFNTGSDLGGEGKRVLFCYEPGYSVGKGGELLQRPAMVVVVSPPSPSVMS